MIKVFNAKYKLLHSFINSYTKIIKFIRSQRFAQFQSFQLFIGIMEKTRTKSKRGKRFSFVKLIITYDEWKITNHIFLKLILNLLCHNDVEIGRSVNSQIEIKI